MFVLKKRGLMDNFDFCHASKINLISLDLCAIAYVSIYLFWL